MKIKRITKTSQQPVFDITVEDQGHYVLKNGVVTHNSGLKYAASTIAYLGKKKERDGTEVIGNIIKVKMHKSRLSRENKEVEVLLSYSKGLDKYYGLLEIAEKYNIFTHMSPSYGQPGRCITVKGINTINHDGELIPCPYMDLSIGNIVKESLATVLDRGMRNKWLGPYRDECIIGEHKGFIKFHNQAVEDYLKVSPLLPVPYEHCFAKTGSI